MHNNKKSNLSAWMNTNRIYVCLVGCLIVLPAIILILGQGWGGVKSLLGPGNFNTLLKTSIIYVLAGIGFTYVMIGGNFDLSIGSTINVGASLALGMFNTFYKAFGGAEGGSGAIVWAWVIAIIIALLAGGLCGAINGWLVAYGKVHSFIVTIGTQTSLAGFVYTYSGGNTISAKDSSFTDILEKPFRKMIISGRLKPSYLDMFTIRFIITLVVLILFAILLSKTRWGRDFLMTGSNREAAWQAGIPVNRNIMMSFVISGFTASLAGILFAISQNAAVPNFGERGINPLMLTLAATIIGGTVMTGGSGSVIKTAVAVVTLEILFSALLTMGFGFDAQVLAAGLLLALIVLYEAYSLYRQSLKKGLRPALMPEAEALRQKKTARG